MAKDKKEETNVKKHSFTTEEMAFLKPRQTAITFHQLAINDMDFVMQNYIVSQILPRLSIDPNKHAISFNIAEGFLTTTPVILAANGQPAKSNGVASEPSKTASAPAKTEGGVSLAN